MIQFWQQILPIWNAQNRQNPVAEHTCLNSNMQSAKFWLSLFHFPGVLQKGGELVSIIVDIVGTIKDIHNFINKKY